MSAIADEILMHYGMPRRSGRYPWGSGEDPYQHSRNFMSRVDEMRKEGFTYTDEKGKTYTGDTAIAKSLGLSTTQFRTEYSIAKNEVRSYNVARARSLQADGLSTTEIGRAMGVNESTVRGWFDSESESKMNQAKQTADHIRDQIETKGMIEVGKGVERELGISKEMKNQALYLLEREGYPIYENRVEQVTNPGQWTTQKVICPKGTQYKDIYNNPDKIHPLNEDQYISRDGGDSFEKKFTYPSSLDSKRLKIRYNEEGGLERDGIVELRRGVDDLSLGESRYSQVRIMVDGTHYIKGMAVYSDDMPPGVDVIFNTNKEKGTPVEKVLKEIKNDPDNPFGSAIKDADQGGQYWYTDSKTGEKKLGLINKRADEGDWGDWKDALPSQFLGKQSQTLAKKQLGLAAADKHAEFDEYCELTNPTVKKHLLSKFADECDSAAVHLQAAALPGQKYNVIIPVNTLKDTEIYAPGYENGTQLALIRYPHGGTFEIPVVAVNNKHAPARKLLGDDIPDAVGINAKVAERLSGADFDGDTVMCIPTNNGRVKITSTDKLKGLEGFDPKVSYRADRIVKDPDGTVHAFRGDKEFKVMKKGQHTETEMGKISNLITDMTLLGAGPDELARAVRHSMVVIDAAKHNLDYKQSEKDNNIAALRKEYQIHIDEDGNVRYGGASTILSRAKGEATVIKRKGTPKVNVKGSDWYDPNKPEGALIYQTDPDASYQVKKINKRTGVETVETRYRTQKSTRMAETDDAYSLVSEAKHPMERIYADYANDMKALANKARLEVVGTGKIAYSATAAKNYSEEVSSLKDKLNTALLNAPRERAANRSAAAEVDAKIKSGKLDKKDKSGIKKAKQQALTKYRQKYGAVARAQRLINITDREWEAIQAGAISESILKDILDNTDVDVLRQRATPRTSSSLSPAKINKIKQMKASGRYSLAEIAKACGCSTSTVTNALKGGN